MSQTKKNKNTLPPDPHAQQTKTKQMQPQGGVAGQESIYTPTGLPGQEKKIAIGPDPSMVQNRTPLPDGNAPAPVQAQGTQPAEPWSIAGQLNVQPYEESKIKAQQYVDNLFKHQRDSVLGQMQGAYDLEKKNLESQKRDVNQNYRSNVTQQDTKYRQNARRLAEMMAHSGLAAGQQGTSHAQLMASNQGALSNFAQQRTDALEDISQSLNGLQSQYLNNAQAQLSDIESQRQQQLLQLYLAGKLKEPEKPRNYSRVATPAKSGRKPRKEDIIPRERLDQRLDEGMYDSDYHDSLRNTDYAALQEVARQKAIKEEIARINKQKILDMKEHISN